MANVMNIIALILGGIGTLTGAVSVYVHILNYRKSKSVIEIEKRRAEINKEDKKIIYTAMIHNKGNSPTTINRCEAIVDRPIPQTNRADRWMVDMNIIKLEERYAPTLSGRIIRTKKAEPLGIPFKLEPNSSIIAKIELLFIDEPSFKQTIEKPIKSEIIFYHTHGKTKKVLYIGKYK